MRVREDMILRQIGEVWAIFPIGEALNSFNRIIKLNDAGAFLYALLQQEQSVDTLTQALQKEYDIDYDTALSATQAFVDNMKKEQLIEGEA